MNNRPLRTNRRDSCMGRHTRSKPRWTPHRQRPDRIAGSPAVPADTVVPAVTVPPLPADTAAPVGPVRQPVRPLAGPSARQSDAAARHFAEPASPSPPAAGGRAHRRIRRPNASDPGTLADWQRHSHRIPDFRKRFSPETRDLRSDPARPPPRHRNRPS